MEAIVKLTLTFLLLLSPFWDFLYCWLIGAPSCVCILSWHLSYCEEYSIQAWSLNSKGQGFAFLLLQDHKRKYQDSHDTNVSQVQVQPCPQ